MSNIQLNWIILVFWVANKLRCDAMWWREGLEQTSISKTIYVTMISSCEVFVYTHIFYFFFSSHYYYSTLSLSLLFDSFCYLFLLETADLPQSLWFAIMTSWAQFTWCFSINMRFISKGVSAYWLLVFSLYSVFELLFGLHYDTYTFHVWEL